MMNHAGSAGEGPFSLGDTDHAQVWVGTAV